MSRSSTPDNDFVDVESTDRPHSSASGSQKHGPPIIPAMPEVKRNRGRPRKTRDNLEDGKWGESLFQAFNVHIYTRIFV